jgi:hypothetical protein
VYRHFAGTGRAPSTAELASSLGSAQADVERGLAQLHRERHLVLDDQGVTGWAARHGTEPGYVTDLATLWRFASAWYEGRIERGYVRRGPATARAYMRSAGLSSDFWGL